ncbi:MAG: xylulokinase [Steroidobacteraceae bacterium]
MSDSDPPALITLGIDLGTSAVKVVAVGDDDGVMGEASASFVTRSELPLQAEQEPADWLHAVSSAMRTLDEGLTRKHGACWRQQVEAIGLTGQLPTLVCLSRGGLAATAVTWKDGRADAWAAARVDAARRSAMYAMTGMPIDGRYLAPMLLFHFADRIDGVQNVLSAKDFLLHALTGLQITEPSTAAGYGVFDLRSGSFSAELCGFWNLPQRLLPQLRPANSLAGPLSQAGAALLGLPEGIPVSTGAADSVCSAYAMAGLDQKIVSVSFGSSAVILGATASLRIDPSARYLVTPHVADTWYGREMDLLATGTGYRWLSDLFGWPDGRIDSLAAESVPGSRGLCFAPYLAGGEQGALWNPSLRGALTGLNLQHSRSDIARAYLEGVFYEVKRCVEVLAETAPVESVRVSGNIVSAPSSMHMLADILDRAVVGVPDKSPAAIGVALLARNLLRDARPSEGQPAPLRPVTTPHPAAAQAYAMLYRDYVARAASCAS